MLDRDSMISKLADHCRGDNAIRAAWLGGAHASERLDEWSDVDLCLLVRDEDVERVLIEVRDVLAPHAWTTRFPQPTFHGHEQVIARPDAAPEHLLLDLVVMKESARPEQMLLEPERHGTPVILFDHDQRLESRPALDRDSHWARMINRRPVLIERFHLFRTLVVRAIERRHVAEASTRYLTMLLLPTIELARMIHCPDRFDFGPRYLDRDLPEDLRLQLERLSCWRDLDELRAHINELSRLFAALEQIPLEPSE